MKDDRPRRRSFLILLTAILGASAQVATRGPSVDDVLRRTTGYLEEWVPKLANVVSTEAFDERRTSSGGTTPQLRRLKSELLLVRYPGGSGWMIFRDVSEADGRALTNQPDRLLKLFADQTADAHEQALRISAEGLRYHLAGASSSVTNPLVGIALLQEAYQPRLRFRLGDVEKSLGPQVRALQFDERETSDQTGGRTREHLPLLLPDEGRVNGKVWLNVESGEILRTEVHMSTNAMAASTTLFAKDARLGIQVPQEMRATWGNVNGVAKYSNYRRFGVTTETRPVP